MRIEIPGYQECEWTTIVLDYNGTIAEDGVVKAAVRERLQALSEHFAIKILTADTHGTAKQHCAGLPAEVRTFPVGNASGHKEQIVRELGGEHCICLGNGRNDAAMFKLAGLSIAILETEGMYAGLLQHADLCVRSIEEGLDLLRFPKRLIADLRG